jgi:tape measure domain-containing protein
MADENVSIRFETEGEDKLDAAFRRIFSAVRDLSSEFRSGFASGLQQARDEMERVDSAGSSAANGIRKIKSASDDARGSVTSAFDAMSAKAVAVGVVIGNAITSGLRIVGRAAGQLVTDGFDAVAKEQRLSASLESLFEKELKAANTETIRIATGKRLVGVIKEAGKGYAEQQTRLDGINISIRQTEHRIATLQAKLASGKVKDVAGINLQLEAAQNRLRALNLSAEKTSGKVEKLAPSADTKFVTTFITKTKQKLSVEELTQRVREQAEAAKLFIEKLAIQSPFEKGQIAEAFKLAQNYGFIASGAKTVAEAQKKGLITAQRVTQALVDQAAATGQSEEAVAGLATALGQIKAKGKVSAEELNQLRERGFDVTGVLRDLGVTLKQVEKGKVGADKFIEQAIKNVERDFGGAAARQSGLLSGVLASFADIKTIGLTKLFTPITDALLPTLNQLAAFLQDERVGNALKTFGERIGGGIRTIIQSATALLPRVIVIFSNLVTSIRGIPFSSIFDELRGAIAGIVAFVVSSGIIPQIVALFSGLVSAISSSGLSGVFTTLARGILSVLSPVNLLIASATLLSAAIATNFGGLGDAVTRAFDQILPALQSFGAWLSERLPQAAATGQRFISEILVPALRTLASFVATNVIPLLANFAVWFLTNLPIAIDATVQFLDGTLFPALNVLWNWLRDNLPRAIDFLVGAWGSLRAKIDDVVSVVSDFIRRAGDAISFIREKLNDALSVAARAFGSVRNAVEDLTASFSSAINFARGLIDLIRKIPASIPNPFANASPPPAVTPGSPSPFEKSLTRTFALLKEINATGMSFAPQLSPVSVPMSIARPAATTRSVSRDVHVSVNVNSISSEMDLDHVARRVAARIRGR